ncbi:MAG: hypothetical protein IPM97_03345 [Bdellovibrionaceae bacterium]|nr:hypothetical protein [Pseudobdellovibrionaceae bacterium]
MFNYAVLFFAIFLSFQSFANPAPKNFDEVNLSYQAAYNTSVDQIADRAFKGVCYTTTTKVNPHEGYIAGIILGTGKGVFEKRIGTVYRLSGNDPYTKGTIFSTLFGWWWSLSPIAPGYPLAIDNQNSPDLDTLKQSGNMFILQSKLKVDFDCTYAHPDLLPLCVNGFIPKGTHTKSCFFSEELR